MSDWINSFYLPENEKEPEVDGTFSNCKVWRDIDGSLHRDIGPSVIYRDGTKLYHYHGKLHRLDGPANDLDNSVLSEYYIHGQKYKESEYWKHPEVIGYNKFTFTMEKSTWYPPPAGDSWKWFKEVEYDRWDVIYCGLEI